MSSGSHRQPEQMSQFFDRRAEGYEDHMREVLAGRFSEFYGAVAACVTPTSEEVSVLDLGCGTGLELDAVFTRVPNAHVTCVDVSDGMLDKLKSKHAERLGQLTIVKASYLSMPLPECGFDYVVSVQTMHHLLHDVKRDLYKRIRRALKHGGKYIEGDYVVSPEEEARLLAEYAAGSVRYCSDGAYHVDIPFSLDTQRRLLLEAGFSEVEVVFTGERAAVYVAMDRCA